MKYETITYPDVNNGIGCRVSLWVNGCTHHCPFCHNQQLWDFNRGNEFTIEIKDKLFEVISLPYIKGLTLTGGDPLDNYDGILDLVKDFRKVFGSTKDIWLFSGYKLEEITNSSKSEILEYIDVLVDGKFDNSLKDLSLAFRGSSNQVIWENKNGEWAKSPLNEKE